MTKHTIIQSDPQIVEGDLYLLRKLNCSENQSDLFYTMLFTIVQDYCKLSKISDPSEKELDQLVAILDLAEYDPELACLLNEADHLIAYELGLSTDLPHSQTSLAQILSYSVSNSN